MNTETTTADEVEELLRAMGVQIRDDITVPKGEPNDHPLPPKARRLIEAAVAAGLTPVVARPEGHYTVTVDGIARPSDSRFLGQPWWTPALTWGWEGGRLATRWTQETWQGHTVTLSTAHQRIADRIWERPEWWQLTASYAGREPQAYTYYGPTVEEATTRVRESWRHPDQVEVFDARPYDPTA